MRCHGREYSVTDIINVEILLAKLSGTFRSEIARNFKIRIRKFHFDQNNTNSTCTLFLQTRFTLIQSILS